MLVPAIAFSWWLVSLPGASEGEAVRFTAVRDATGARPARPEPLTKNAEAPSTPGHAGAAADAVWDADADDGRPRDRVLYRGLITPAIAQAARSYLDLPMGAERAAVVDGEPFLFVLEPHYHPPGFVGAPTGWHKGVSVYVTK